MHLARSAALKPRSFTIYLNIGTLLYWSLTLHQKNGSTKGPEPKWDTCWTSSCWAAFQVPGSDFPPSCDGSGVGLFQHVPLSSSFHVLFFVCVALAVTSIFQDNNCQTRLIGAGSVEGVGVSTCWRGEVQTTDWIYGIAVERRAPGGERKSLIGPGQRKWGGNPDRRFGKTNRGWKMDNQNKEKRNYLILGVLFLSFGNLFFMSCQALDEEMETFQLGNTMSS